MSGLKSISYSSQRGQAAVMVMLFMAILVVSGLTLFKQGKLTSNKMQLQNAADAAAYSMSVVEARDMNFTAYINRAIVANEVAIGQSVGLASWAYHFKSYGEYLSFYNTTVFSPLTLGASNAFITPFTSLWATGSGFALTAMKALANGITSGLHVVNKIYGMASSILHVVSIISSIGVLDDTITQNGPPGAKLSDFGIVSLIAHIATIGIHPSLPGDQFTTIYSAGGIPGYGATEVDVADYGSTEDEDGEYDGGYGYARLQALIRDSRDPFSMYRGVDPISLDPDRTGWELHLFDPPIDINEHPSYGPYFVGLGTVEAGFDFVFYLDLSLERKGGTEMRFVLPDSGDVSAGNINWSAADATGFFVDFLFEFGVWVEACPLIGSCFRPIDSSASVAWGSGNVSLSIDFWGINIPIVDMAFPDALPFGAGFAEVAKTDNNLATEHMELEGYGGVIESEQYGEAAANQVAWVAAIPGTGPYGPLPSSDAFQTFTGSQVNKSYKGLPYYVDTNSGHESFMGVGAPNIIIGLVQDESDFDSTTTSTEPTGRFALNEALADDELAVLAKSELYFARPTDRLAVHFHREDGYTETGNAFNPYWQARLIETEYADRILALLIQQKEDFANLGQSFNTVFGSLLSYLP